MVEPVPQHCPTARELDDLELLLTGAYPTRDRYDEPGAGPVTLDLPVPPPVELVDPEGLPLARLEADGSLVGLAAHVSGPFRRLYAGPRRTRAAHRGAAAFVVAGPMTEDDLAVVRQTRGDRPVLLLALAGHGTPQGLSPVGLLRATLAAARVLGDADVVAVLFPSHGDPDADRALAQQVVATYADDVHALPGTGEPPAEVAAVVAQDRPAPDARGLVVFLTGLSGSGKSTIARALHDRLLEDGRRTVTSLDGDVVRRHLSAGLGFSRQDRETNVARIGWVAAEIARHHGVAICSPIAPYDATRRLVRGYVQDAGGAFFLVHVATPLDECERRDRKGLYAKARRGEIADFTGISAPYEEPRDADLRVDTTGRSVEEALDDVLDALAAAGLLDLGGNDR